MEEEEHGDSSQRRNNRWNQKDKTIIRRSAGRELPFQERTQVIAGKRPNACKKQSEESLGAVLGVFGEEFAHENEERGEEERKGDAVQSKSREGNRRGRRQGKEEKAKGVGRTAQHHNITPSQALQARAQNVHHGHFEDHADIHHRHEPFGLDAERFQEAAGQEEVRLVDGRINEGDDEQGQEEGLLEEVAGPPTRRFFPRPVAPAWAACGAT